MSDGITMGTSTIFYRLMIAMGTQKGGASSSTRLQPQLTSSSLGLTPALGSASDVRGLFADVMTGIEELRQDMTKTINRVEKKAHQGHERLRGELEDAKSQCTCDQVQLIQNTDQCLAESLELATKKSEKKKDRRMMLEIERLLNDHDNTYVQTTTTLENRLDNKADLMMRKLGELLSNSNQESRSVQRRTRVRLLNLILYLILY